MVRVVRFQANAQALTRQGFADGENEAVFLTVHAGTVGIELLAEGRGEGAGGAAFLLDLDHEVFQVDQLAAQLGVDHDASLVPAGFHVVDLDHLIADDGLGPFFFAACGEYEKQTTQEKAFHDCPAIAFH